MRRSKAEVERYIASVQGAAPTPREKSMKGFFFAKLYYEAKEYELAKRYISSYLDVQERDPKALKFLGHLYEVEGLVDKAVGCYKSSVELNPTQKDLVLKIAELLCDKNADDGRAEYWVEKAAKLFPGSPAVYKLKEKLLNFKGDVGWNQLFDLIQSELYSRPDDVYVNIRLVELYRANKRLEEAVDHCLKAEKKGSLRASLEWCSCVVRILKEYLKSLQGLGPDKSMWRTLNQELLLAHCNLMLLTLSTKDVQECRRVFQSFDQVLQSVKPYMSGTDDLSVTFLEIRGHFYMHAGTLLLKMAQHSEAQWRAVTEPAALCYLIAFQVPKSKNKCIKGGENGPDLLEMLTCDRRSQTGHMLRNLSHNKDDFLKGVVETFANKSGRSALFEVLFEKQTTLEQSFLGCDDIRDVESREPELAELARCDIGSIHFHYGNLHHLAWLGLQCHNKSSPPAIRKWLKQLFPRLPQETARLDTNAPESICILDLEVFLLAVIFESHLQLQDHFNTHYNSHQPRCLPLAICTPLGTERQKSWWDAVYNLIHKKTQPGASAKLRLLLQHELITLRALDKHGLQPAVIIHWARNLHKTGSCLNSYYDQKDYMVRCVHYWKKVLPLLESIKKKKSIPEPIDPFFKHFHSQDIQISEVADYEEEAQIAFASLDVVDGKFDDAVRTFDEIKNVVSYWNLARIFQRKAEDIENDAISPEEQEECTNCLQKSRDYLTKIIDESFADSTVAEKLPVSLESVKKMLDSVLQELGEYYEDEAPVFKIESSRIDAEIKHSTPSPTKFSISPNKSYKLSPKTPPRWVEDQKALLQMLCHQVEALKNEVQELKLNSNSNASPHRWPSESFGLEHVPDGYRGAQISHGTPLTVSTSGSTGYYNQSPSYNSKYLLRTATNDIPTKVPVYGMNRLVPQQQMYTYQQQIQTPPLQSTSSCKFPRETFNTPMHYESPAPTLLSPRGDEYYNYSVSKSTANPPLPEPGYFTKPTIAQQSSDSMIEEFANTQFGQTIQTNEIKMSPFMKPSQATMSAFKFTSNFQSNDGDFTFSTPQFVAPNTGFTGSECLFSLLTSDKTFHDIHSGQKAVTSQTADQRDFFNFGSKSLSGGSCAGNTAQTPDKTPSVFDRGDHAFSFQNPRMPVLVVPDTNPANVSHDSDRGSILGAEEDGPHFEPVVPLPDKVEVKTGEEDEEELFSNRAKLFRFDAELKEWKERGVGIVKILRHKKFGKMRLLMRREQVLKICANHYINPDMTLKPNAGSNKSYVWHALDYADEMPKPEQLAIRFKTPEEASLFKHKFEEAQKLLREMASVGSPSQQGVGSSHEAPNGDKGSDKSSAASANFGFQFTKKLGEWECDVCLVRNAATASACAACQTPNVSNKVKAAPVADAKIAFAVASGMPALPTFSFGKSATDATPASGFGGQFTKRQEEWDCEVCLVRNPATALVCVACQTACPNVSSKIIPPIAVPRIKNANTAGAQPPPPFSFSNENTVSAAPATGFGEYLRKKKGQWGCSVCLVTNEESAKICAACQTSTTTSSVSGTGQRASSSNIGPSVISSPAKIDFGARFSRKEGQWDCNVCLVRNEASSVSCVSCLTPNPQVTPVDTMAGPPASGFKFGSNTDKSILQPSGFGTQFLKKEGQWDCSVCLVRNESSLANCASCQTPNPHVKPGAPATPASSGFTFGLKSKLSEPASGKPGAESKSVFSGSGFKFGHAEQGKTSVPATGFGQHLRKKGQWDCNVCLVRNEQTAEMCVACHTLAATVSLSGSDQQAALNKTGPASIPSSVKINFGARFSRKEGQWDCNVCLVRNEASSVSCVSCLTPNPQVPAANTLAGPPASGFKFGSNTDKSILQPSGFGTQFLKKEGQWDCSVCLVRNESSLANCASCQTPNPCVKPGAPATPVSSGFTFGLKSKLSEPASGKLGAESKSVFSGSGFKFGQAEQGQTSVPATGFGQHSRKKKGHWDCGACLVPNEETAKMCVACQAPAATITLSGSVQQASSNKTGPASIPISVKTDIGARFSRKEGQWDCSVCLVRNEASSVSCAACQTPNPQSGTTTTLSIHPASDFKFGSNTDTITLQPSAFGAQFSKKEGQWDCKVCLVRNESSLTNCASCQAPNPCVKTVPSAILASSAFTFGLKSKLCEPTGGKLEMESKSAFSESGFKFGHTEQVKTTSSMFQMPSFNPKSNPAKEGFSFAIPASSGGFKFGTQSLNKNGQQEELAKEKTATFHKGSANEQMVKQSENATVASHGESIKQNVFFDQHINTFSFATASESGFAKKDLHFKGISPTSKNPNSLTVEGSNASADQEKGDELYQTEDRDDIHFEPVVQLPEKIALVTGEEEEKTLYSERVKLFRFDADTSQWKERGVGNLKILRNELTGALRLLMRRDQVLKVCANHWITSTVNLKPLSGSDRAWMWLANDFSDGGAKLEQLAAKFKTPDQAQDFKYKFEESQRLFLALPPQTPRKLSESGGSAQVKVEEINVIDGKNIVLEQTTKLHDQSKNSGSMDHTSGLVSEPSTGPSFQFENLQKKVLGDSLSNAVYDSHSASTPVKKNLFSFGESAAGFNFSFQPVSPSKSPTKLNQSRVSVGTDEESDVTQEEERDGQYFEPVVPLPDLVEVSSGEENEQVLFGHRAKLYRFDKDANQWKERGIGDIKVLQNYDTKSVRIIMRRDQVFKLCANHRITPDLNLKPMAGTERAWVWTAHDFSEGEGKIELFAVRFKLQDVADSFQKVFDEAKQAQESGTLLTPVSPRGSTPKVSTCGKMAVAVLEETTRERTNLEREDDATPVASPIKSETSNSSETPTKTFVSPPKFVFGSDSVKNIFSSEKPKSFTFGSTSTTESMFGFNFNPLKSICEKKTPVTKNVTVKRLNFNTGAESQECSTISEMPKNLNHLMPSTLKDSSGKETPEMPVEAENRKEAGAQSSSEDVFVVYELVPTSEQKALAESLQLPSTFFCYKNMPDYVSDDDQDDEDFETSVKNLNGRLYLDGRVSRAASKDHMKGDIVGANRTACIFTEVKAENVQFRPTSFCDVTDKGNCSQAVFGTVHGIKESQNKEVTSAADTVKIINLFEAVTSTITVKEETDSATESTHSFSWANYTPVDLSTKDQRHNAGSTSKGLENFDLYGFSSSTGQSFADLASNNSGDFAFGTTDKNFTWQNSGAVVFASLAAGKKGDEDDSGGDDAENDDIHFEPIVSLPEVQVKSGEEDEEVLFKERTKMYRFDRDAGQWKERGVGEIKILYHAEKKYFRVLMRRDQVLKVCANHVISKSMDIQPLSTSNNALVWTATDYSDGEGRVEQLAVRFKTQDLADSFKMKFEECQKKLPELTDAS